MALPNASPNIENAIEIVCGVIPFRPTTHGCVFGELWKCELQNVPPDINSNGYLRRRVRGHCCSEQSGEFHPFGR
jgi:hypothetical protein